MSQYGVDYLRRLRAAVEKFEEAFDAWMSTQVESDHMSARGLFPTVWTKEGLNQSEVQRLELGVAEAAGLAASAVSVTGAYIGIAGLGRSTQSQLVIYVCTQGPHRTSGYSDDDRQCQGQARRDDRRRRVTYGL